MAGAVIAGKVPFTQNWSSLRVQRKCMMKENTESLDVVGTGHRGR